MRAPLGGRATPQNVRDFLSLSANRTPSGLRGDSSGGLRGDSVGGLRGDSVGGLRGDSVGGLRGDVAGRLGRNSVTNVSNLTNVNNVNSFNRLNVTQINNINTNINTGFKNYGGWGYKHGNGYGWKTGFGYGFRTPYWNNWCAGVHAGWRPWGYGNCFTPRFWASNYCYFPWARSYYWWGHQPWSYWWNTPTWGGLCNWFGGYGWNTPNYYGYGSGGNVIISNDYVYVDDQPIATVAEYAGSAAALAEVPTPANPDQPTEWLPLGTFALSADADDKQPSRVVQLAVDKDGVISGTMTNQETKQTYPIQGRVDKETQRVAFTIGDAKDVVFETGIFNLTQQQTPVLAHGEGRDETYLLLRLEPPKEGGEAAAPQVGAPARVTPAPPQPMLP